MLRLSLAGIAVYSFLDKNSSYSFLDKNSSGCDLIKYAAAAGVGAFAISIACSLWFLFGASEGLRWYIAGLRHIVAGECPSLDKVEDIKKRLRPQEMLELRLKIIRICRHSKLWAAIFLAIGAGCMAGGTVLTFWFPPVHP